MTSREQRRAWVLSRVLKRELTMTEAADMVGLSGLITPSLEEMSHVAREMERRGQDPAPAGDIALRVFGFSIGLLILGVIWLNARWLRLGFPLLSLALIGLSE